MKKIIVLILLIFIRSLSFSQKTESIYLNPKDSATSMYIAVVPEGKPITSFLFLLDGFGNSPRSVLTETNLPRYAADKGILTIIPLLKTGAQYFGSDSASQQSLKEMIALVAAKYGLNGKPFYIGGFSIGGTCVVKYAELAAKENYPFKPRAVFAVDPPLDWERYYNAAQRVVRLSERDKLNGEVTYMLDRIKTEMRGTPATALENFYNQSPYSYSDTTQRAVKLLIHTPVMLISEPDIEWWLIARGYDYSYINITDHAAMINELQRMGNKKAVLVTTTNRGYRNRGNFRHPHSWSIVDPAKLVEWLHAQ